jgi:hypothetical protein
MLVANANVLEVGLTGGAHGWLRVRAEVGHTGEVTASLVATNAGATDALHKQLGDISAYLKNESVAISSLVVAPPERVSQAQASASHEMASGSASAGSQAQGSKRDTATSANQPTAEASTADWLGMPISSSLIPQGAPGISSGGWLNVVV